MVEANSSQDSASLLQQLITKRGISKDTLEAEISSLPDEGLMANIEKVAERISRAMFKNEPLVIFGHDDPDGITSTYILYQFFNACGYQKHHYFIPNRNIDSHGIQQGFVEYVRDGGYKLVITVDNGIASRDGVEQIKSFGCDTVITDHHLIQTEQLPDAYAILNPQLPGCEYPFKSLAGVGVVLMLIRYLGKMLDHTIPLSSYFWTAVGTISDKMPMTGLNRIIIRHVIKHWKEMRDPSVEFLLRNSKRINGDTDIFNFITATGRLIANGRELNGQHTAMRFLLQSGDAKAELFQSMESQKNKWESELNRIFGFLDIISAGFEGNAFIYFDDDSVIPYPLLGTAATYILGKLNIPTIMLKLHNGDIVCEGRCGEGFNMVEAFRHCKDYLKQYGGHVKAAGFTLEPANYDGFLECYNNFLMEQGTNASSSGDTEPDASLLLSEMNADNWRQLEMLLPFGQQNPEPRIQVRETCLEELQQVFTFEHGSLNLPAGKKGNTEVLWKTPRSVRILSFSEIKTVN